MIPHRSHRSQRRRLGTIAGMVAAIAAGSSIAHRTRAPVIDAVAPATDLPASTQWLWVTIIIGALGIVATIVALLRSRDKGV